MTNKLIEEQAIALGKEIYGDFFSPSEAFEEFRARLIAIVLDSQPLREVQRLYAELNALDKALRCDGWPIEARLERAAMLSESDLGAKRYEFVRRLNPREFAELYDKNIKTGVHFDELVSQAMKEG